jgi:hypothetical protein
MTKYFGVTCKTKGCGAVLALGLFKEEPRRETIYAAALESLRCPTCQKESRYESEDIYYFEAEDVPWIAVRGRAG